MRVFITVNTEARHLSPKTQMNSVHILPACCNTLFSLLKFSPPNLCAFLNVLNGILQNDFVFWLGVNWCVVGHRGALGICQLRRDAMNRSIISIKLFYCFLRRFDTIPGIASPYGGFMTTLTHTTVGRTPLGEWSARRRDLYRTTHNTHSRQTSMPSAGFEPTVSAGERPQTDALDRADTGTGESKYA